MVFQSRHDLLSHADVGQGTLVKLTADRNINTRADVETPVLDSLEIQVNAWILLVSDWVHGIIPPKIKAEGEG